MELASGIHRIEAPFGDRIVCSFFVEGGDKTLLVDSGIAETPSTTISAYLAELARAPSDIDVLLVSHADADHSGGNAALKDLGFQGLVACHGDDRLQIEDVESLIADRYREFAEPHDVDFGAEFDDWVRSNVGTIAVNMALVGGEGIDLGSQQLEIIHTPGHSLGHLSVYAPASKTAIIADAVLGRAVPNADGLPSIPPTYRHVEPYLATIDQLAAMEIDTLLCSHFPPLRGADVQAFLQTSRTFVEDLDTAIADAFERRSELGLRDLVGEVPASLGGWPAESHLLLAFAVAGHLERLIAQEHLTSSSGVTPVLFRR